MFLNYYQVPAVFEHSFCIRTTLTGLADPDEREKSGTPPSFVKQTKCAAILNVQAIAPSRSVSNPQREATTEASKRSVHFICCSLSQ